MYQNAHFLNHFFALLDFGSRDEERRTKGERRGRVKDRSGENKWSLGVLELAFEGLVEDGGQEFCFDGDCGFG
jgi:hypothetical protein